MLLAFRATSAIIASVILAVGVTFAVTSSTHSTYVWRAEKSKAVLNLPPFDSDSKTNQSELSTLV